MKDYSYSLAAIVPSSNLEAIDFIIGLGDEVNIYCQTGDFIAYHAFIHKNQYKQLYVMSMNKEAPLHDCFLTFKSISNWRETVEQHMDATLEHHKVTHPDKYMG